MIQGALNAMSPNQEYENLPECIKCDVTEEEYLWMGDENRAKLQEELTMPEVEDD